MIIYTIEDEDVQILHVFHGRQDIEGRLGPEGNL
jgi:plasmid stabilization system protein ParE